MPSTSGDASDTYDIIGRYACDYVSMPSTSGDASDLKQQRDELMEEVSMPSTSGDASDRVNQSSTTSVVEFQCPQHRAMHLTPSLSKSVPA